MAEGNDAQQMLPRHVSSHTVLEQACPVDSRGPITHGRWPATVMPHVSCITLPTYDTYVICAWQHDDTYGTTSSTLQFVLLHAMPL